MTLDRLWAGWRIPYLNEVTAADDEDPERGCVFCRILASDEPGGKTYVVWRDDRFSVLLNAYPYVSGHLLVMPVAHVADIEDVDVGLWPVVTNAVRALRAAYEPEGLNIGINLGRAAGAGVPGHFHVHVLPRWSGDTNFLTTVAEVRVLPESLPDTYDRLRAAWPVA
ncbi:MAG: HIT family protein [Acidimicrobiales bacterium]